MDPRKAALSLALLATAGCSDMFGSNDPHTPGTDLGSFHVVATEVKSTCGEGALGSTKTWEFDVRLSRAERSLYWDNGAQVITGDLAPDGVRFSFSADVDLDMRTEDDVGLPPCSIARHDESTGSLSGADEVTGFSGSLSYAYAPEGSCDDLVHGKTPVFAALPCSMAYGMTATQSGAR